MNRFQPPIYVNKIRRKKVKKGGLKNKNTWK